MLFLFYFSLKNQKKVLPTPRSCVTKNAQRTTKGMNQVGDGDKRERAVIATADDAILSKLSTCSKGYYDDPFLPFMAHNASGLTTTSTTNTTSLNQYQDKWRQPYTHSNNFYESPFQRQSHPQFNPYYSQAQAKSRSQLQQPSKQTTPLIRKGTYVRVCVIDKSITSFLNLCISENYDQAQIVILGSGKDTTALRYQAGMLQDDENNNYNGLNVRWYEVDHDNLIKSKQKLLETIPNDILNVNKKIISGTDERAQDSVFYYTLESKNQTKQKSSPSYLHLVPFDLNEQTKTSSSSNDLITKLRSDKTYQFEISRPTLFVLECVQMYLDESPSCNLLSSISSQCQIAFVSLYDPILLDDNFGQVMQKHLERANAISSFHEKDLEESSQDRTDKNKSLNNSQSSMVVNRTLQSQCHKLVKKCGFSKTVGSDLLIAFETILTQSQRRKANQCEWLDEYEEFHLIMKHYCFVVAGICCDEDRSHQRMVEKFCGVGSESSIGFQENKCFTMN